MTQPSDPLPHRINGVYRPLCQTLTAADVPALAQQVRDHVAALRATPRRSEFFDVALAERLAATLLALLAAYATFDPDGQAALVGAARYFLLTDDADHDAASVLGLDDDVIVLNHVLARLGRRDLLIRL